PDLAMTASNAISVMSIWLNTTSPGCTTATFATPATFNLSPASALPSRNGITVADFNGDGKLDLALSTNDENFVSIFLNQTSPGAATASFSSRFTFSTGLSFGDFAQGMTVGDLNGDGLPDVVVASTDQSSDGFVSVLLNTTTPGTATPTFTDAAPNGIFASGAGSFSVTIADFNMDGVPDLAVANFIDNNVNVLLNTITPGALIPSFASPAAF